MFISSGKCNIKMENGKNEGKKTNINKRKSNILNITNTEKNLKMLYK
jgi:hypothetical protein